MSEEKKGIPPQREKGTNIEKGVRIDEGFNKIPDFKFTPPPPPPPSKNEDSNAGEEK